MPHTCAYYSRIIGRVCNIIIIYVMVASASYYYATCVRPFAACAQVYCWHSCMKIPSSFTCQKSEVICANVKNGLLWPQNYTIPGSASAGHCMDCTVQCPAMGLPASASTFCNTNLGPTSMWMTGFQVRACNCGSLMLTTLDGYGSCKFIIGLPRMYAP